MKSHRLTTLLGASLIGLALSFASIAQAQTAPNARVNSQGQLEILDGSNNVVQTIDPPAGSVAGSGNLTVGGPPIQKPTATVLGDGSLDLGNGTVLQVPDLPSTGNAFIDWINKGNHATVQFDANKPATDAQMWWSYTFKAFYHDPAFPNFAYLFEAQSWVYFYTTSGVGSMDGVWSFMFNFPKGASFGANGSLVYWSINNFAGTVSTGTDVMDGWLIIAGSTAGAYKWKEFGAETWLYSGAEQWKTNP